MPTRYPQPCRPAPLNKPLKGSICRGEEPVLPDPMPEPAGIVTGAGEDVFGLWLAGAGERLGAPIPTRIADQLRGKSYNSFDALRKALWTAVASDGELATQFNSRNLTDMANGLAPISRKGDQVGKRKKYEMHHVEHINEGGAVYDLDNLRVVTVRRHIDIHKEGN